MKAEITTNGAVFHLKVDYYMKEWTSFLKSLGATFNSGVWTIQIKHLSLIEAKIQQNNWSCLTQDITPGVQSIELSFNKMNLPPRDYQKVAANLMANNSSFGLFDDCGLGKTISTLSAIQGMGTKDNLIVAEIKSLHQWESEIEKFLGGKTSVVVRGTPKEREVKWGGNYDFHITNYHTLINDFKYVDKKWDTITFDEASRYMRNRETKISSRGRELKSDYKWVLTGSPIENYLADIFSLYEVMNPSILGDWKNFEKNYIRYKEIVVGKKGNHLIKVKKIIGYRDQDEVKRHISPYFIRRTEEDVKGELPDLIEQDIKLELKPEQRIIYDLVTKEIEKIAEDTGIQITSLGQLTKLRRVCDSSTLVDPDTKDSCKFDEILKLLYENNHRKVIIFSQWTEPLQLLSKDIDGYSVITGGSRFGKRDTETEIEKFMNGPNNILLSSDAGSRSLNLQKASMIINLDLPWNPQTIKQRIGRIRRIGSEHSSVLVYNLLCKNTIEEGIVPLLRSKLKLAEDIIDKNIYNTYKDMDIEKYLRSVFK